jgi:hypothetical protein
VSGVAKQIKALSNPSKQEKDNKRKNRSHLVKEYMESIEERLSALVNNKSDEFLGQSQENGK